MTLVQNQASRVVLSFLKKGFIYKEKCKGATK